MRRHRTTDNNSADSEVNLTPMLDVVFIMLIFFVVTTSFVKESGVEVNRPSANTAQQQESANILIAIRPNGEIWIDGRAVDVRAVRANIERLRAEFQRVMSSYRAIKMPRLAHWYGLWIRYD